MVLTGEWILDQLLLFVAPIAAQAEELTDLGNRLHTTDTEVAELEKQSSGAKDAPYQLIID